MPAFEVFQVKSRQMLRPTVQTVPTSIGICKREAVVKVVVEVICAD
jgi:hypothetical protein